MSKINSIATIIIAGGKSSRMGRPKGLMKIKGKELLQTHIDSFSEVSSEIVVVLGHHIKEYSTIRKRNPNVTFKINDQYEHGPFSSIKKGFEELDFENTFILPVDNAPIKNTTIKELIKNTNKSINVIKPTFKNKSGHPILLSSEIKDQIKRSSLDDRLDVILRSVDIKQVSWIEVDDLNISININTPEMLQKINS